MKWQEKGVVENEVRKRSWGSVQSARQSVQSLDSPSGPGRQPLCFVPLEQRGRKGPEDQREGSCYLGHMTKSESKLGRQGQWRKGITTSRSTVNSPCGSCEVNLQYLSLELQEANQLTVGCFDIRWTD